MHGGNLPASTGESGICIDDQEWTTAAQSGASVLITSDDHDERSRCARWIHEEGGLGDRPFIAFDCGPRPPSAQLPRAHDPYGQHQASSLRHHFAEADGGTFFLDCVEMLHPVGQDQLFALLERRLRRSQASMPLAACPVRVITGASEGLAVAIAAGRFDECLFYRLNVIHLDLRTKEQP